MHEDKLLAVSNGTSSTSITSTVQEIWSWNTVTSRNHSSNCDGDVTILEHVFILLYPMVQVSCLWRERSLSWSPNCQLWLPSGVGRNRSNVHIWNDSLTNIPVCTKIIKRVYFMFISQAHSSTSDGDATIILHTFINFNPCCIQQFKSHVNRC